METLEIVMDNLNPEIAEENLTEAQNYWRTRDRIEWCGSRIFELQTIRDMLPEDSPYIGLVNQNIDLLFAEKTRLLGVMNECNREMFGA